MASFDDTYQRHLDSMTNDLNVRIWHYLDLAKYVGLLSRGLFFARPSALRQTDPWEGTWGEREFIESIERLVHAGGPGGAERWHALNRSRRTQQEGFGLSCWHASDTESAALWQLYTQRGFGVAVLSTPAKVQLAVRPRAVEIRHVDYSGHKARELGDNPIEQLTLKRPEFRHEAEVRFFAALTDDEITVLDSFYATIEKHGEVRRITPGNRGPLITGGKGFAIWDHTCMHRGAPAGVHLPTDASALIEGVRLAPGCPYPLRRAVIDVTERFGLPRELVKSADFDVAPYDRVRFTSEDEPNF
jgi:hypothetical protein